MGEHLVSGRTDRYQVKLGKKPRCMMLHFSEGAVQFRQFPKVPFSGMRRNVGICYSSRPTDCSAENQLICRLL